MAVDPNSKAAKVGFAAGALNLSSCLKEHTCQCPQGTTSKMKAMTKKEARRGCEVLGCTLP